MCLTVTAELEQNHLSTLCVICGRMTGSRVTPNARYILHDDEMQIGDMCERCAYGSTELWHLALMEYATRLETKAVLLRELAGRTDDGRPLREGMVEDLLRQHARSSRPGRPPFFPPHGD